MIDWIVLHEEYYSWFWKKFGAPPNSATFNVAIGTTTIIASLMYEKDRYTKLEILTSGVTKSGRDKMLKKFKIITFDEWLNIKKNHKHYRRPKKNKK